MSDARVLLLIDAFTRPSRALEGRTKLAKLDFFIRYPAFLQRALSIKGVTYEPDSPAELSSIETHMVRYKYGPWDPEYFAIIGRLVGRGLVEPVRLKSGIGYKATTQGHEIADSLGAEPSWATIRTRCLLAKRHLDLSGGTLKDFVYEHFPEVVATPMGERL